MASAYVWLNCFLFYCLHVAAAADGSVTQGPVAEVSALRDTNVTLHCDVTVNDDIDFVLWKKILNTEHDEVLIHNNHTTNVDKYRVDYPHALVILGVDIGDEGLYQCEVNQAAAQTTLHVLIPPNELTLEKIEPGGGIEEGAAGSSGAGAWNLSCRALHARPPSTLSWFMGTSDVTAHASSYVSTMHADGYGDSESVLHVPAEWTEGVAQGTEVVIRCVAGVGDPSADLTAFLFLTSSAGGAEGHRAASVNVLSICLLSYLFVLIN